MSLLTEQLLPIQLLEPGFAPNGTFTFSVSGSSGTIFTVEVCTNLINGSWVAGAGV